ncbi:MAG: hypothetical protein QOK10_2545 [Pseudonocardiales bacterium]|jgi:hypothetical protein|nr:hypothetical protein [Pseudonocardiales bacterium]
MTASPMAAGRGARTVSTSPPAAPNSLADLLERVLDKGVVIVGDVVVSVLDIDLLTLKLRLLIASVDTAQAMGIDWWKTDPFLSSNGSQHERGPDEIEKENAQLRQRISELEGRSDVT